MNTYQKYLVLDMLTKRLEAIGLVVMHAMFSPDYAERGTSGAAVDVSVDYTDASGKFMTEEEREAKLNEFLGRYPDTTVVRENPYGKPDMLARGVTSLGVAWEINFHSGVCTQVQVGTKTEERFDPEALASIPKITVEVPVYEYMCPDPIISAGLVSA